MFPNPSSGILNIETDVLPVNSNLRVFSINGRLLFEAITNGPRMQFNFADLPQGMYFVQCGELSKKLILLKD